MLTDSIQKALEQLRQCFAGAEIETVEDGSGGAYVTVSGIEIGTPYAQERCWFGFHITAQYPYSDIYPHFVQRDLHRLDGRALGEAISEASFQGRLAYQISRKSNRHDHQNDTAALKLMRIINWLKLKTS